MRTFALSALIALLGWAACAAGPGIAPQGLAAEPGSQGPTSEAPAGSGRPNLLYIMTDQQRFDALGVVNPTVRTPALDRFAKQGVRFDSAYVAQALCTPSRASIFTGLYPHAHKLQTNVYKIDSALADPQYHLGVIWPKLLRQAGYYTAYIGRRMSLAGCSKDLKPGPGARATRSDCNWPKNAARICKPRAKPPQPEINAGRPIVSRIKRSGPSGD